jgi:hypothetical protein
MHIPRLFDLTPQGISALSGIPATFVAYLQRFPTI